MLSYAFQCLKQDGYKNIETEPFDNVQELFAAIIITGVSQLLKRGLGRSYLSKTEPMSALRGKLDITASLKTQSIQRHQLVCCYDEFSVNNDMNRILKTTMTLLVHSDISKSRKKALLNLMTFFDNVELLDMRKIQWRLQYNRNNQAYHMLISICYLVIKGLLQTQTSGTSKLMDYLDEQRMSRLYEKFILEYYRKEHPQIQAHASQISWQLDDDFCAMLPVMQTDIMLSQGNTILIIDAKYYSHTTQQYHDKHTIHSSNLYQLFTYVKNKNAEYGNTPHEVSGMLLYAKTDEKLHPNQVYRMSGNKLSIQTLDLNCPFQAIAKQLDDIVKDHFN
jgi:5-methylcytosine-specific restriction enzyme subunit McrC